MTTKITSSCGASLRTACRTVTATDAKPSLRYRATTRPRARSTTPVSAGIPSSECGRIAQLFQWQSGCAFEADHPDHDRLAGHHGHRKDGGIAFEDAAPRRPRARPGSRASAGTRSAPARRRPGRSTTLSSSRRVVASPESCSPRASSSPCTRMSVRAVCGPCMTSMMSVTMSDADVSDAADADAESEAPALRAAAPRSRRAITCACR